VAYVLHIKFSACALLYVYQFLPLDVNEKLRFFTFEAFFRANRHFSDKTSSVHRQFEDAV